MIASCEYCINIKELLQGCSRRNKSKSENKIRLLRALKTVKQVTQMLMFFPHKLS